LAWFMHWKKFMIKKIYFLGYSQRKTQIIKFLKEKNFTVKILNNRSLSKRNAKEADLIISFGYKKIIKNKILKLIKRPIINLHISYLPYNRGAHPNFWSFYDNTPKGVSIHEIDEKIDKGNLIYRKKVKFQNIKKQTFQSTYNILLREIENLFIKNFKKILNKNYLIIKYSQKGSYHSKKDIPKNLKNWNINIDEFLKVYKK